MLNSRRVLAWPRAAKRLAVIALDVVLAVLATWIAYARVWITPTTL